MAAIDAPTRTTPGPRHRPAIWLVTFVTVALLFGGFAVPRLLHTEVTAGETAAISALINLSEAEAAYRERYRDIGFAPSIAALAVSRSKHCDPLPEQACLVDIALARNNGRPFRGYYFADTSGSETPRTTFTIVAVPVNRGRTGVRAFCVVERGVARYKDLGRDASPQQITREQCLRDFTPLP
jgi:hypothetical protein